MLKDTIISAFNYDGTLLKWLKKVEDALQNASASEFRVNKKGNATISFSIVFANGDTLESGDIILQQGESVTGATIRQGHLILTLSNGNELDAGDLGAVTGFSINGSQHLIVTYQNGTTQDLGAIFTGNVNVNGSITANDVYGVKIEAIKDANGHNRFIEGNINTANLENLIGAENVKYAKWSLSGTHLMVVLAIIIPNGTTISSTSTLFGAVTLPAWVHNKIYPIVSTSSVVSLVEVISRPSGQDLRFDIDKSGGNQLTIYCSQSFTSDGDKGYRIQFDLLIDNE